MKQLGRRGRIGVFRNGALCRGKVAVFAVECRVERGELFVLLRNNGSLTRNLRASRLDALEWVCSACHWSLMLGF